ncbi:MAG: TIR domain-containing protein [Alphaproteobacteria bacterium]|jgi:hypothetical protein|nr:TIR domain-containing protein [Alphaproteobacteria bacterium]
MNKSKDLPLKLFISYSWSSENHQQWVLKLATELRCKGVDVILDKWDLKEGSCMYTFMEKMVSDEAITKVIIICDKEYQEKADKKTGGVGTETQIISPKVYNKANQNKFVAVISEKDNNSKPYLPAYLENRIHIDLSDDGMYSANFKQLLRWIYDKPTHIKPPIGQKPKFLNAETSVFFENNIEFEDLKGSIRDSNGNAEGRLDEFLSNFINQLGKFRIAKSKEDSRFYDELLLESIEKFIPYRNQIIELITLTVRYDCLNFVRKFHKFFEELFRYTQVPSVKRRFNEQDSENFKFILHELFLYTIAIFLKHEKFDMACDLMHTEYYLDKKYNSQDDKMSSYYAFYSHLHSLAERNIRLKLNRVSVHADLLKDRSIASGVEFNYLIQADFILYLYSKLNIESWVSWHPMTMVYLGYEGNSSKFRLFSEAKSAKHFVNIKKIFNIKSKEDFTSWLNDTNPLKEFGNALLHLSLENLVNYDLLDTAA